MEKKRWQKPELVTLVRSRPEEAVLATCKFDFIDSGPVGSAGSCRNAACADCATRASS